MKKTYLWSLLFMVMAAFLSVSLVSCGDDDGNENEQKDDNSGGVVTPTNGDILTSVISEEGDSYLVLNYDAQGRVTRVESEWGDEMFEIAYDPIAIKEYESSDDGWKKIYEYSVTTDNKGRISKIDANGIPYETSGGVGAYTDFVSTYTYDSDGYLATINTIWGSGENEESQIEQFTWNDGNLTSISWSGEENIGWMDGGTYHEDKYTYSGQAISNYSSQVCTEHPITLGLWFAYLGGTLESVSGLFGKTCKNLPSKVIISGHDVYPENYPYAIPEDDEDEVVTLSYTLNSNGTVATEAYTDNYDGEEEAATLRYVYNSMSQVRSKVSAWQNRTNNQRHTRNAKIYVMHRRHR